MTAKHYLHANNDDVDDDDKVHTITPAACSMFDNTCNYLVEVFVFLCGSMGQI